MILYNPRPCGLWPHGKGKHYWQNFTFPDPILHHLGNNSHYNTNTNTNTNPNVIRTPGPNSTDPH